EDRRRRPVRSTILNVTNSEDENRPLRITACPRRTHRDTSVRHGDNARAVRTASRSVSAARKLRNCGADLVAARDTHPSPPRTQTCPAPGLVPRAVPEDRTLLPRRRSGTRALPHLPRSLA